jgi:hypothetical protein
MTTTTAATSLPAGIWNAYPVHSSARFRVRRMGASPFRAGGEIAAAGAMLTVASAPCEA